MNSLAPTLNERYTNLLGGLWVAAPCRSLPIWSAATTRGRSPGIRLLAIAWLHAICADSGAPWRDLLAQGLSCGALYAAAVIDLFSAG